MMSPLIREIRRVYHTAHITLMIYPRAIHLAETCPYINELILNYRQSADWSNIQSFFMWNVECAKKLLNRHFDICFAPAFYLDTAFLMYMSGAKTRISNEWMGQPFFQDVGYDVEAMKYMKKLLVYTANSRTYGLHNVDGYLSLLDHTLHSPVANREIEVWITKEDVQLANSTLKGVSKPIYALCMGGSERMKHYPPEKYAKLIEMILNEEPTSTFIILGGGQIDLQSAEIFKSTLDKKFLDRIIDLTNKLNCRQSAAALINCAMYIGNDTGGTMLGGAAVKCPVLATNCYSADLPEKEQGVLTGCAPYHTPSVIVLPEHALPECAVNEPYNEYGCRVMFPHCITQIAPETIFKGFHLLKERIAKKIIEPLYIY